MYNGIGLTTPRGSGTNGYVVRNLSTLRSHQSAQDRASAWDAAPPKHREPDQGILEHERKRKVEVKCLELQVELEDQGVDEDEIDEKVNALRTKLLANLSSLAPSAKDLKSSDTHGLAAAKKTELSKMARALGTRSDYAEGDAFDKEKQEEIRARRMAEREEKEQRRKEDQARMVEQKAKWEAERRERDRLRRREEDRMRRERDAADYRRIEATVTHMEADREDEVLQADGECLLLRPAIGVDHDHPPILVLHLLARNADPVPTLVLHHLHDDVSRLVRLLPNAPCVALPALAVGPAFALSHGKGSWVWDVDGKKYLDFSAGIAVNALGHADEGVAKVLGEQAGKLLHTSNVYHHEWAGKLAELLVTLTAKEGGLGFPNGQADDSLGSAKVFFSNSGTEANEGALKVARKVGKERWAAAHPGRQWDDEACDKTRILCFEHSFHGRSMGALSITSNPKYQKPFLPLIPGVDVGSFNDFGCIENLVTEQTCAVILEPIQGEGGIGLAQVEWLKALRKKCDEVGAVLIYDEIQKRKFMGTLKFARGMPSGYNYNGETAGKWISHWGGIA
ncbi:hypothetical protein ONZ45_g4564 [Pleurotus djamor]|nr:hypothetical protein ONZ45_g4564 [Pleurotus djamor]